MYKLLDKYQASGCLMDAIAVMKYLNSHPMASCMLDDDALKTLSEVKRHVNEGIFS